MEISIINEKGTNYLPFHFYYDCNFFFLLRNNGLYVFMALIPFILYSFRKSIMKIVLSIVLVLILQFSTTKILYHTFDVVPTYSNDIVEMISIPLQQIARTVVDNGSISQQEIENIELILPLEKIKESYNPQISDNIKTAIRAGKSVQLISDNKFH